MNNKTILYVGIAAAAYYLYTKSKKKPVVTLTVLQIQAMTDSELTGLLSDILKNPKNYVDATMYANAITAEQKRRLVVGTGGGTTTTGGGGVFSL
jgi:hypothetical protein